MRISIVTETYLPQINGVALTLQQEMQQLQARGHQLQLVRPRFDSEPSLAEPFELIKVMGFAVPRYPGMTWGWCRAGYLQRRWQQQRPDVVYIATEGPLGYQALKAARRLAIPVLSGFHTHFQRYCQHYGLGWLESSVFAYLRHFHNRSNLTLVPTEALRRELTQQGVQAVEVLGRGVDLQRFNPEHRDLALRQHWGLQHGDLAVIHVGRLAAEKNIAVLIRQFHQILNYEPAARLVLVGDGPLRDSLQARYPEFIFCGTQTGLALSRHYASADLMLFPSLTETFGNVVLEAMASGLLVAAFDTAAASLFIQPWHNGILAEPGNEAELQAHLKCLLSEPGRLPQIRQAARQRATESGWSRVIDRLESLMLQQMRQSVCIEAQALKPEVSR